MRPHPPDAYSLTVGLAAVLAGVGGLTGWLDVRALGQGWLVPALVLVCGLGVVVGAIRRH